MMINPTITDTDSKVLMFDPWLTVTGQLVETVAKPIADAFLVGSEGVAGARSRQPKADQIRRVGAIATTITANLYVLHREKSPGSRLAVPMKHLKLDRYDRPDFGQLPRVVDKLADLGFIEKHAAEFKRKRTTIEPTAKLADLLANPKASLEDISRVEGGETIWLTARVAGRTQTGDKHPNERIPYEDTAETRAMGRDMATINTFLASSSITLEGEPQAPFMLTRRFLLRHRGDPHRFNLHGRLYGGFWQELPKVERHRIRINGEPIADLDFASMFVRLAYLRLGKEPPEGDLYAIPGLEDHRDGAKRALSALLSTSSDMTRLPRELGAMLPDGWTAKRLKAAVSAHHPDLAPLFGKDLGLDLMFTESRILVAALLRLVALGIPALPMHDGIMVPASGKELAKEAMTAAAKEIVGFALPVDEKTVPQ